MAEELPVQIQLKVSRRDHRLSRVVVIQHPGRIIHDELPLGAIRDSHCDGHIGQLAVSGRTGGDVFQVHIEPGIGAPIGLVSEGKAAVGGECESGKYNRGGEETFESPKRLHGFHAFNVALFSGAGNCAPSLRRPRRPSHGRSGAGMVGGRSSIQRIG